MGEVGKQQLEQVRNDQTVLVVLLPHRVPGEITVCEGHHRGHHRVPLVASREIDGVKRDEHEAGCGRRETQGAGQVEPRGVTGVFAHLGARDGGQ